jgi:hypothetical protein
MGLLTNGNRDLRRDRIWTWSLPAWVTPLEDGRTINTCPSAGECAPLCYARKGTYRFSNVKAAHVRNLLLVEDHLEEWEDQMALEVQAKKFKPASFVRIHDAGDFYKREYLEAWLRIIRSAPHITFYAYTKEIALFKEIVEPDAPANFSWIYSYGGRQDSLIEDNDRQCDVFPSDAKLEAAGFVDQADSDLLAITGSPKVGIVVNNHAGAVAAMKGMSMKELQRSRHSKLTERGQHD